MSTDRLDQGGDRTGARVVRLDPAQREALDELVPASAERPVLGDGDGRTPARVIEVDLDADGELRRVGESIGGQVAEALNIDELFLDHERLGNGLRRWFEEIFSGYDEFRGYAVKLPEDFVGVDSRFLEKSGGVILRFDMFNEAGEKIPYVDDTGRVNRKAILLKRVAAVETAGVYVDRDLGVGDSGEFIVMLKPEYLAELCGW